jgi:hypothetical protein
MANPNIVAVTSIYGKTAYLTPANTTANVLLANAASSWHSAEDQPDRGCEH